MAEAWLLTSWNDAGDAVIATDAEGRVAELNRAAARLTGWSAPEALGSPIAEVFRIVDGSTRRPIEDPAGRALSGGGTVGLADPTLLIDRSGMECPIEGSATAVRLGSGGFAGAVLVFRAVRGRRADLLPDQGEERLRLALTAARMVAWQWNPPDGSRRVSDNAPDVFGLPAGTTLLSIDQWLALLHPEDIEGYRQVYGRAIETRESYLTHYRLIRPDDGRVLWMEERGHAACDESGAMARLVGVVMDVTDARRAEDRLRIARSRLESTLSVGEIGTWEYDASRGVVTADRNLARIYGVTPEGTMEGPVDRFLDIIHPEDHERIIRGVGAALESGETYEAEYRLVLPDRSIRWVIARARVVRGDSGQDVRMPGVVVDITKLKRAEEALRETRSRLDSTLAAGEIGTWEFDPNADVVLADPNLARMFGVTPEEAAGGRIGTYLRAIHPDDRDRVAVAIGRSIEEGEGYEADYRLVAADGSIRWVVARGRVERDEDGRPRRLPGVVIDVTGQRKAEAELRASEERRRLALDTAELGAWNIDSATLVLRSDERFRMIVRGSAAPIAFEEAFAAIHPDDRDRVRHAVAAAMRADHPRPFAEEYRVIHPDRSTRWVFGKGRAHYEATAAGRRLASLDGTVADITDRKLGEQEREHLVGQLREQDLRKDDFLATLAHELRNPLAPIRNGLQILKVGGHDPPAVEEARVLMERPGSSARPQTQLLRVVIAS